MVDRARRRRPDRTPAQLEHGRIEFLQRRVVHRTLGEPPLDIRIQYAFLGHQPTSLSSGPAYGMRVLIFFWGHLRRTRAGCAPTRCEREPGRSVADLTLRPSTARQTRGG